VIVLRFTPKGGTRMNKLIFIMAPGLLLLASVFAASATGLHLGGSAVLSGFEVLPIVPVATKDKKGGKGTSKPTGKQTPQKSNTPKQPNRPKQRAPEYEYYV